MNERFERWNDYSCKVKDNQEGMLLSWEDVVKKLNEQQSTINKLKSDIEETEISIKLFEDDIATKDKKIKEQQATINELQSIINHCKRKTESGKKMNEQSMKDIIHFSEATDKKIERDDDELEEPVYYNSNGLSPNRAFEQGLISNEEFIGFIKGNVVKYVVRCGKKGDPIDDIYKAIDYLQLLKKIMINDE